MTPFEVQFPTADENTVFIYHRNDHYSSDKYNGEYTLRHDDGSVCPSFNKVDGNGYCYLWLRYMSIREEFSHGDPIVYMSGGESKKGTYVGRTHGLNNIEVDVFIVIHEDGHLTFASHCQHPPSTATVTLSDGTKVELSKESVDALREGITS